MNLGTNGASRAAGAVLGTGPYHARFGVGVDPAGVVGEPTPGVNGYARPTVTFSTADNIVTVTSSITLGPATGNVGLLRAISLHNADGTCIACGSLDDSITFNTGETPVFAANKFVLVFKRAGET
jgi:hypothetical protein